ncbi:MAG TPA: L,D-transpeptidase family protein [Gaiellaceae bacterium]
MRRALGLLSFVVLLAAAPANAAAPVVSATASPTEGAAPLAVTLTATGDAATYHWDLGDGTSADGTTVQHAYPAGDWTATVTATAPDGETAQAQVHVVSHGIVARAPASGRYGRPLVVRGTLVPATANEPVALYLGDRQVALARTGTGGAFALRIKRVSAPGPYVVRTAAATSAELPVAVAPVLRARLAGSFVMGRPLAVAARLSPARGGTLHIRIWRGDRLVQDVTRSSPARVRIDTRRTASLRVLVQVTPASGFLGARRLLTGHVVVGRLAIGASGPSVLELEQRLAAMHYALEHVDSHFGDDTYDAVLAFQKVHGLGRSGVVDATLWKQIFGAATPRARYSGNHVEVDKARQVLFEVRNGKVVLVVHVSTGATGNTPLGLWHVYRRVAGWDWVLYYPNYFLRGFAIHGYPDVPAYPASHGCVRVPLWVAPRLYAMEWFDEAVYVYQ